MELNGKVAIVTGASSGIGLSTARLFAQEGAKQVLADLNIVQGEAAAADLRSRGAEAVFVEADVADPAACKRIVDTAVQEFGRLDCAVNNAGIGGSLSPLADYDVAAWNKVLAVNLSSAFYCMKYQIPAMLAAGGGAIVNMASILGMVGFANAPAYVAAKHGLVGLTKNAALEYSARGIRVNAIGPAFISTPMISAMEEDAQANAALVALHPIGRLGRPEEVAELALWLCSDRSSFVCGAYYAVDGGYLAR